MLLSYLEANRIEAGCDEAGRGCLAGSVYAAAVILPPDFHNEDLNDSKQLSEKKRYALRPIIEREAIAWAVGIVTPEEIDRINILKASFLAMHRAIDQLTKRDINHNGTVEFDGQIFHQTWKGVLEADSSNGKTMDSTSKTQGQMEQKKTAPKDIFNP